MSLGDTRLYSATSRESWAMQRACLLARFGIFRAPCSRGTPSPQTAGSPHGPWRLANSPALAMALPNAYFDSFGIPRLTAGQSLNPPNRRMRTRTSGGVGGEKPRGFPLS